MLHVAVDDATRLAYTEILPDEKKSGIALLSRSLAFFKANGVALQRIIGWAALAQCVNCFWPRRSDHSMALCVAHTFGRLGGFALMT